MRSIILAIVTGFFCIPLHADMCVTYVDQYISDPTQSPNGYSNHDGSAGFGPRYILDDFDTHGEPWKITCFSFLHVWDSLTVPSGTGVTFEFWGDDNGAPDPTNVIAVNVNSYEERAWGGEAFFRPIMESMISFDQITLSGRYWFHATINGPENNFMLVGDHRQGSELWVDYHDFGGLQPGTDVFGVPADAQYVLYGPPLIPEPSSLTILSLAAITLVGFRGRLR